MQTFNEGSRHLDTESSSVWELIGQLIDNWTWLFGGLMTGLIASISFLFWATPKYESIAIVQPATIGTSAQLNIGTGSQGSIGAATMSKLPVEPVNQTLERLKVPTFYSAGTIEVCDAMSSDMLSKEIKSSLVKNNSLISIKFRSTSPTHAEQCVTKVVEQLSSLQNEIARPLIQRLQQQMELTKLQIEDVEAFLDSFNKSVSEIKIDAPLSSLVFLNAKSKREELLSLRKLFNEQSALLSEPLTQPLTLIEKISTSDNPVFPKTILTIAGGIFSGLFGGLLALFVNLSWRRFKEAK